MTLESKFDGTEETAALAGAEIDASKATAAKAGVEMVKIRSIRRLILASPHWAPTQTEQRYGVVQAIGKRRRAISSVDRSCRDDRPHQRAGIDDAVRRVRGGLGRGRAKTPGHVPRRSQRTRAVLTFFA